MPWALMTELKMLLYTHDDVTYDEVIILMWIETRTRANMVLMSFVNLIKESRKVNVWGIVNEY